MIKFLLFGKPQLIVDNAYYKISCRKAFTVLKQSPIGKYLKIDRSTIQLEYDKDFLEITNEGFLTIKTGYSWDGPSDPAIDTKTFMRGSLVHDALYQLMREGTIDFCDCNRKKADQILEDICKRDGMSKFRAKYVYWGVRIFGYSSAKPNLLSAPDVKYTGNDTLIKEHEKRIIELEKEVENLKPE